MSKAGLIVPVILAGGLGQRLWPLSREAHPKQFISFNQEQSLFQQTLSRLKDLKSDIASPIVVGNEQHRFLMAEQMRNMPGLQGSIILEPFFKGTAAAVGLAAVFALAKNPEAYLLVMPSDHRIENTDLFHQSVQKALRIAKTNKLITFGVKPTSAHTGYGYIQKGEPLLEYGFKIEQFVEKPTAQKAAHYLEAGDFFWNSGIFLFSAASFLQELLLHVPKIYHAVKKAMAQSHANEDFIRPDITAFEKCPVDSIDYAIMERTSNAAVVPLESDWSDVGCWNALADFLPKDSHNNATLGDVMLEKTKNCLVQSHHRLVVGLGVSDLVIIETSDAVLVLDKAHAQDIKTITSQLSAAKRKEALNPQRENRPWGQFESIDSGDRFQVKRITVAVNQRLSLQRHHHRSEHWVVVKGTARVLRGEEDFLLSENQSTYIPIGVNHRLENVGKIPLEIIEIQSGTYLGEDDIIRLDDQYGRLDAQKTTNNNLNKELA